MEQPYMLPILYSQYQSHWCPGDFWSQGISRHGINQTSRNTQSLALEKLISPHSTHIHMKLFWWLNAKDTSTNSSSALGIELLALSHKFKILYSFILKKSIYHHVSSPSFKIFGLSHDKILTYYLSAIWLFHLGSTWVNPILFNHILYWATSWLHHSPILNWNRKALQVTTFQSMKALKHVNVILTLKYPTHIHIHNMNCAVTVPADALAPQGARTSAGTDSTTNILKHDFLKVS